MISYFYMQQWRRLRSSYEASTLLRHEGKLTRALEVRLTNIKRDDAKWIELLRNKRRIETGALQCN
jgi:hypothetical protein